MKTEPSFDTTEMIEFMDINSISGYAKDAVEKLVKQGLISGKSNNLFDPKLRLQERK